jgi:hypothetical protein
MLEPSNLLTNSINKSKNISDLGNIKNGKKRRRKRIKLPPSSLAFMTDLIIKHNF